MRDHIADAAIASAAAKTTTIAAGVSVLGGISATEVAAIGGLLVAILGLLINWYYRRAEVRARRDWYRMRAEAIARYGIGGDPGDD